MKYLKKFNNHTEYTEYMEDSPLLPNVSYCVTQDEVHFTPEHDYSGDYFTLTVVDGGTVTLGTVNNASPVLSYSTDNGTTWTSVILSKDTTQSIGTFASGDEIIIKGVNDKLGNQVALGNNSGVIGGTAKINASGNIMSLLFGDNYASSAFTTSNRYGLAFLFGDNTNLLSAEDLILPSTALVTGCYYGMFKGCASLTSAPVLPASTLAEQCYSHMFMGCASLTTAPVLSATTLERNCYDSMFNNCTSLTTAPELPALTLVYCCYYGMFSGCTSLNYVKMLATDVSATSCVGNWMRNVSATGTFVKNASAQWTEADVIPSGWTVETA